MSNYSKYFFSYVPDSCGWLPFYSVLIQVDDAYVLKCQDSCNFYLYDNRGGLMFIYMIIEQD